MKEIQRAKGPIPASQLGLMCSSQTFLFVIFDHGELNLTDFRRHRLPLRSFIQPGIVYCLPSCVSLDTQPRINVFPILHGTKEETKCSHVPGCPCSSPSGP